MTIDEIIEALQVIRDAANDRDLTDEEAERFAQLEADLAVKNRTVQIRSKIDAYMTPVPGSVIHVATPKEDDTLGRAFDHYLRTGKENADLVELRAQGEAAGSDGGYLVPDGFRNKLIERMKAFGGIANVVETITTATGNPLPWPTVDDTANVGEIVAEGGTFSSGADLVFGNANLGAYKYMAGGGGSLPLRISVELLQDAAFDVQGLVTRKLGERIARIQSTHLISGTGVYQPKGIVHGLSGFQMAANTAITYDDLVNITHAVDPAYRESARWAMNDTTLGVIQKIKDSHGDPIWRPSTADMGTGLGESTLMGYPVTIDQGFATYVPNSATVNWGVFGNLPEGYVVRRVRDVALLVNPWTRQANGQVEFAAWARMDATQQNTNAYTAITGKV